MKIPYSKQSINQDDIRSVCKALKSAFITQGPTIAEFEQALCKYTGAQYAVAVCNGTAALHVALLAAGIKPQDEVITSPISFLASANCAIYCGAKPVFADVDPHTINISPEEITKKLTRKTKALIPVHFAGQVCDMKRINKIAQSKKITVIEDASHSLGADYLVNGKWKKVGACDYSDMTVFSFHPVKSMTTGEGGAILTNDKNLYDKLRIYRTHGMVKHPNPMICKDQSLDSNTNSDAPAPWYYEMQLLGFNYRITDLQCALGLSQLRRLDGFIQKRRQLAKRYISAFSKYEEIGLQAQADFQRSAWHLFAIRLNSKMVKISRRELFETLQKNGLGVQVHYIPIHLQPYYRKAYGYKRGDFPNAEMYYDSVISIPLYPQLTHAQQTQVINMILKAILHD